MARVPFGNVLSSRLAITKGEFESDYFVMDFAEEPQKSRPQKNPDGFLVSKTK